MDKNYRVQRWRRVVEIERKIIDMPLSDSDSEIVPNENLNRRNNEYQDEFDIDTQINHTDTSSDSDISISDSDNEGAAAPSYEEALQKGLAKWAMVHNCTHVALKDLLKLLQDAGHTDLPKDPRTILATPRTVIVELKSGGDYVYVGISEGIVRQLAKIDEDKVPTHIDLQVNADGIPIFKSANVSLWPILGFFKGAKPFIIAIFCGRSKPTDVTEFINPFLEDLSNILQSGVKYNSHVITVSLIAWICDAPARQFLKCIKGHTGYNACERCEVVGEYIDHRVVFTDIDAPLRTDEVFLEMGYPEHQLHKSPLSDSGILCVKDFTLDYMHCVCLGVVKRMMLFWKEGPRGSRLSNAQLTLISNHLESYRSHIPSEFNRRPRRLDELKRWKATEFRQFLLYTGPVALRNILSGNSYINFMSLSIAMRIMLDQNTEIRNTHLDYSHGLMRYFVSSCADIYGPCFVTYNAHSLIHLADDVRYFNTNLDNVSCFPYENYLQKLKSLIRNHRNPLAQVVKRSLEFENSGASINGNAKEHLTKAAGFNDSWFTLHNGNIACIKSYDADKDQFECDILSLINGENLFQQPCQSKVFGMILYRHSRLNYRQKTLSRNQLKRKVVCLKFDSDLVFVELLHNVKWS